MEMYVVESLIEYIKLVEKIGNPEHHLSGIDLQGRIFGNAGMGIEQTESPVIIRVPGNETTTRKAALLPSYSQPDKYEVVNWGSQVAILALGKFFALGEKVKDKLEKEAGINATLINPRYVTGVDEKVLRELEKEHQLVLTLEDGVIDGGFGEKIARFYGCSSVKVLNFGAAKEFVNHVTAEEQYDRYHLTAEKIYGDIVNNL